MQRHTITIRYESEFEPTETFKDVYGSGAKDGFYVVNKTAHEALIIPAWRIFSIEIVTEELPEKPTAEVLKAWKNY